MLIDEYIYGIVYLHTKNIIKVKRADKRRIVDLRVEDGVTKVLRTNW